MGMAEWTPKASAPPDTAKSKQAPGPTSTTKRAETTGVAVIPKSRNNDIDDDQDFDF
jgi:hypothetical protein